MHPAPEYTACDDGGSFAAPAGTSEPLNAAAPQETPVFVERRKNAHPGQAMERRQFTNSYEELSPEARELGRAVDEYKFRHHRRFINYEELLAVIRSLGYHK
ncbi:hypothetical protein [Thermopirellula anaerolimosa]